jgi:aspartyl-tRNA(Asn)/glutamyl-tRNA(Gln) amidotransferase subunit B
MDSYGLSAYDAQLMVQSRALSDFFEAVLQAGAPAKEASNWLANDLARLPLLEGRLVPAALAEVIALVAGGKINRPSARQVVEKLFHEGGSAATWVEQLGLAQIGGGDELRAMAREVVAANPTAVAEYRSGKEKALNALVGQVMKKTQGRANAAEVMRLIKEAVDD